MSRDLAAHLRALHAKEITFTQFYRRTRLDWRRMSFALYRSWKLPPTVTVDDVEQEMLLGAWSAVRKWNPDLSPLRSYVVFYAHDKAQKWIHQQRGCNLHTRKGASQYAWCIASLAREGQTDGSTLLDNHADEAPGSERTLDYSRLLEELPEASSSEAGRVALRRFIDAGGDEEKAARAFHGDPEHRVVFRLRSRAHAREIIRQEVRSVRALLTTNEGGG